MKNRFTTNELIVMAFLSAMGIVCKPLISPIFNVITDFLYIPGGSCVAGFSMMFLILGKVLIQKKGVATMMAAVQGVIAFSLGVSGFLGIYIFVAYTIPGIAIDLTMHIKPIPFKFKAKIAGAVGVVTGATLTNAAFFKLSIIPLLLFYSAGILSGFLGGHIAYLLSQRLKNIVFINKKSR